MFLFIARIDGLVFPAAFSSGQTIFDRRGNLQLATAVDYFKQHGKELRGRHVQLSIDLVYPLGKKNYRVFEILFFGHYWGTEAEVEKILIKDCCLYIQRIQRQFSP